MQEFVRALQAVLGMPIANFPNDILDSRIQPLRTSGLNVSNERQIADLRQGLIDFTQELEVALDELNRRETQPHVIARVLNQPRPRGVGPHGVQPPAAHLPADVARMIAEGVPAAAAVIARPARPSRPAFVSNANPLISRLLAGRRRDGNGAQLLSLPLDIARYIAEDIPERPAIDARPASPAEQPFIHSGAWTVERFYLRLSSCLGTFGIRGAQLHPTKANMIVKNLLNIAIRSRLVINPPKRRDERESEDLERAMFFKKSKK